MSTLAPVPRAFYLLIALLALAAAAKPILFDTLDPDCFWHLRVADQIAAEGVGPLVDRLSFGSTPEPWTPYSWLAELGMRAVWNAGGFQAALLVHAAMNVSLVLLIALVARTAAGRRAGALLGVIAATAMATFVSLPYLSFRPATLAIVLLAVVAWLLTRDRVARRPTRAVWLIVPLTALLANIHLFAFLVPIWTGCLLAGALPDVLRRISTPSRASRPFGVPQDDSALSPELTVTPTSLRRPATLFLTTLAASLATPLLPGVLRTLVHYQFADAMVSSGLLAEMRPFWAGPLGAVSAVIVLGCAAILLVGRKQLGAADVLLLAVSAALLLSKGRYAPLFILVAAPLMARVWPGRSDLALARRAFAPALAALLVAGMLRLAFAFPTTQSEFDAWLNRHGPEAPGYPTSAADFVAQHVPRRTGRVVNVFNWGGYLGWRLGPAGFQTLMDGRTQCFTGEFWRLYYLDASGPTADTLRALNADAAILPKSPTRLSAAVEAAGWRIAHEDDRARVWVPTGVVAETGRD